MSNTTRRHPRSLREIGPWPESCLGIEKPIQTAPTRWERCLRFAREVLEWLGRSTPF